MKTIFKNTNAILLLTMGWLFTSCETDTKQNLDSRNWQLVWSDEFEGASGQSPDATKWGYDIGMGNNGWGNQELQFYTNRVQNVSTDGNGNLVITALKENYNGAQYTSARIKTKGKFTQQYGRFEARLKTPYGQGIWPAFWMLGDNFETVSWPNCGEIDIMELRGQLPSTINGTIHGPGYSGANAISGSHTLLNSRFDTGYHVFAAEWDAKKIDFFVDGYLYKRIAKSDVPGEWVFDQAFFMILNIAVGGNYVGLPNNTYTVFPQKMTIDYVRVYQ
ncbi:MAG: Beta-glucanase precursor [Bacteroidota bacterium]|jgi:beta-glucanase (GH16 family)